MMSFYLFWHEPYNLYREITNIIYHHKVISLKIEIVYVSMVIVILFRGFCLVIVKKYIKDYFITI